MSMGIPQGSVGPTLFVLFTNDLPSSVPSGSVYMYANDTTIYGVGETAYLAIDQLNKALRETAKKLDSFFTKRNFKGFLF